jgi:hypothetical protein
MLELVAEIRAELAVTKRVGRDQTESSRQKLANWAKRPSDLAFLKAALGRHWNVLDATAPEDNKPGDVLEGAALQANHTGWFGDTHDFDINEAAMWIQNRGGDGPQTVLGQLYTADPNVRAQLLKQMKQRDLLEPFLDRLSWRETKELHDSLGLGFGAIKTDLQNHFIGRHGYGDSLATEWETHENSLHHHIGRIPGIGGKLNWLINTLSYGFTTPYGTERDAWTNGDISKSRYIKLGQENVGLTMVMVALSEVTQGLGDKALRASTAARGLEPTAMRTMAIQGGANAFTATAKHLTQDAWNVYVAGEQAHFASIEDYVKGAMIAGAQGAATSQIGPTSQRAWNYLKSARNAPTAAEPTPQAPAPEPTKEQE